MSSESEDSELVPVNEAEARLTSREMSAYRWQMKMRQPEIAPPKQAEMFELYLAGKTCAEIVRLNKGFTLAQVVQARIKGDWDSRRDEHIRYLLESTRTRVQQVQLDSLNFASDGLSVMHKALGDAFKRYIQAGDATELSRLGLPFNLKTYKELLELLRLASGQDQKQDKGAGVNVHVHTGVEAPILPVNRAPTTVEAASIVKSVLDRKKSQL